MPIGSADAIRIALDQLKCKSPVEERATELWKQYERVFSKVQNSAVKVTAVPVTMLGMDFATPTKPKIEAFTITNKTAGPIEVSGGDFVGKILDFETLPTPDELATAREDGYVAVRWPVADGIAKVKYLTPVEHKPLPYNVTIEEIFANNIAKDLTLGPWNANISSKDWSLGGQPLKNDAQQSSGKPGPEPKHDPALGRALKRMSNRTNGQIKYGTRWV